MKWLLFWSDKQQQHHIQPENEPWPLFPLYVLIGKFANWDAACERMWERLKI